MINTQRQLHREIYAAKKKLKDKDVFLSKAYEHMLTEMGHGITHSTFNGKTHMYNSGDAIAYTDGDNVFINYASSSVASLTRSQKHNYFLGLNLHEYGHILFTDFSLGMQAIKEMENGRLYPMPIDNRYLDELLKFFSDENSNLSTLTSIYHHIDNSIEDGFVDRAACNAVPGYASCLRFENEIESGTFSSYFDMENNNTPKPLIFANLILQYSIYGTKGYEESDVFGNELLESFENCLEWLRKAVYESRPIERKRYVNTVFCHLFHFIHEEAKKQEQDISQNTSSTQSDNQTQSNNQNSIESLNNTLNQLNSEMPKSEKTEHTNCSSPSEDALLELESSMHELSRGVGESTLKNDNSNNLPSELDRIVQEVAISSIHEDQEKNIKKELTCNVSKFLDGVQIHNNIHCNMARAEISSDAYNIYNSCHHELDSIVRKFIKDFQKEIKERQLGDTLTGLYAGKRLDTNHLYRDDKRIFSRKILPEDIPDMAVGILIDCSGSMSDCRIEMARKCAYITYSFCKKMNIPCFVFGHNTSGYDVNMYSVADENSLDNKDSVRIFDLKARGSNRDGFALRYCLKKLESIQAQDRLMLVISDGKPAHNGYGMESGQKDCQEAVHDAIKKGIYTIAAGLGTDSQSVYEVYKQGRSERDSASFLDISNIEKMPKAFIKIIKNKLE